MKINVSATLFAPSPYIWVGASNPQLFERNFQINLELTPKNLEQILRGSIPFSLKNEPPFNLRGSKYNSKGNILVVSGRMASATEAYIKALKTAGWVADEDALKRYGFPRRREVKLPSH
jgi:hypothetical protein